MKQYPRTPVVNTAVDVAVNAAVKSQGFTLIEIVIALAIIALLTAVAYPSYNQYTERSKLGGAVTTLANLRLEMQQVYLDSRSYLKEGTTDECAVADQSDDNFTFTCSSDDAKSFSFTATNKAAVGLGSAESYTFSIDQAGRQKTLAYAGETQDLDCWQVHSRAC